MAKRLVFGTLILSARLLHFYMVILSHQTTTFAVPTQRTLTAQTLEYVSAKYAGETISLTLYNIHPSAHPTLTLSFYCLL